MSKSSYKKCSKCYVEYDQDLGSSYSLEVGKQRRIFNKNGKHFCFNCLASEHNVNCSLCHKRINSKDELGFWSGVIRMDGEYCADADHFGFRCLGCIKVDTRVHRGDNPNKCRIAGCSQKAYYECMDLCLHHSRPCKGGKIMSNGKRCRVALGSDEENFCEFCKNQTETIEGFKLVVEKPIKPVVTNNNKNSHNLETTNSSHLSPTTEIAKDNNYNSQTSSPLIIQGKSPENSVSNISLINKSDNGEKETLTIDLKNVEEITLTAEGNLIIKFSSYNLENDYKISQDQVISAEQVNNNQELQKIRGYLLENEKQSLRGQQELMSVVNSSSISPESSKNNNFFGTISVLGIAGVLLVGVVIVLLIREKTNQKLK